MSESPVRPLRMADFNYELPPERIAQNPIEPRDNARLLVVPRGVGEISHRIFRDLPDLLEPDDLLIVNETRVTALRLFGRRQSGGVVEVFLLRPAIECGIDVYEALVRPGRKIAVGDTLEFPDGGITATVVDRTPSGGRILRFVSEAGSEVSERLESFGRVPLPPYITAPLSDRERYQTVYARTPGSAAAPTAGLHFTSDLMDRLEAKGLRVGRIRLDVGLGTFRPIQGDDVLAHEMHREAYEVSPETADAVNNCRGRVIAVGTTSLRALETAALAASVSENRKRRVAPISGETQLFVYPGFEFKAVDGLITNFHQPHSTLLLLVAAFAGSDRMRSAYATAVREQYRFLSFGDAMLII
jgi:S-adenosylmethionine:tRNA ribosyltransferase-isomerase